jgi:membrane fusion protein, macrolide-specific efflux system
MQLPHLRTSWRRRAVVVNLAIGAVAIASGIWAYQIVWAADGAPVATSTDRNLATVATRTVTASVSTSGTVAGSDVVSADFATTGTVTAIYVTLGEHVTKGQKVARIDGTAAAQQLRSAEDNLTSAEDTLTTAKASADTTTIDSAETQVSTAEAAVTTARASVTGTVLTAPIAGTVIAQNGVVGSSSTVSATTGFVEIADMTKMEVDTDFPEADATKLKTGMPAAVSWTALTGATATGTVLSIDPSATTTSDVTSYGVVVKLTSLPSGIRIGQSTTVVVTTASATDVLAVPATAITTSGTRHTVIVVANGKDIVTAVGIGVVGDSYTQVTSGLTEGERLVLPAVKTSTTTSTTDSNPFSGGGGGTGGGGTGGGGFGGGAGTGGGGGQ